MSLAAAVPTSFSAQAEEQLIGRSVTLAGRKVSCGKADIYVDRDLPSEGGAGDTVLILNPDMMNQQPPTVRLFVFTHECGHISVGDSELDADCFAVNRGVRERWLDRKGLTEVCDSFEGAPETDTHPSAKRRCANLDRCFAKAMAEQTPIAPTPVPAKMPPKAPGDDHRRGARIAGTKGERPGAAESAVGLALHRSARGDDGLGRPDRPGDQERRRAHRALPLGAAASPAPPVFLSRPPQTNGWLTCRQEMARPKVVLHLLPRARIESLIVSLYRHALSYLLNRNE